MYSPTASSKLKLRNHDDDDAQLFGRALNPFYDSLGWSFN